MTNPIEADDGRLITLAPAHVFQEDHHADVEVPSDLVANRGDFGFATGRYCQWDDGSKQAFNRNGNQFGPPEAIHEAAKLVRYTPLNMLHRRRDVVGTFVGTSVIDPNGALGDALVDAAAKLPFPYIDSLAAVWKYHFREEWNLINQAFNQGACWLSMEAVAESLTCMTPGCSCNGATYDYMGISDPSYCDALNTPRSRKYLNYPHYVGGAMVVPPAMPAWRRADITKIAATLEQHPEQAEMIYNQIAASASHLSPAEWEFVMALVLADAFGDEGTKAELSQADVDRIFSCLIPETNLDAGSRRQATKDDAAAEAAAGALVAAGLFVVAKDSGRLLMLQRAVDPADPASGMWEAPGGHIDPGETALDAAKREFTEEVGCVLPDGQVTGTWMSPNGVYQGFVYLIGAESDITCNMDSEDRHVLNPDDPDGDNIEVVAWWDPAHLPGMPALRSECESTDWDQIVTATDPEVAHGIPQDDANYRQAIDEETSCGACGYFEEETGTCELVAGKIDAAWTCDWFTDEPEGGEVQPIESGVTRTSDQHHTDFSAEEMATLGKAGKAFRNANGEWSYPTPNAAYVHKAMQAFGRSNPKDRRRLKAYLKRRATAEGLSKEEIARIDEYSSS